MRQLPVMAMPAGAHRRAAIVNVTCITYLPPRHLLQLILRACATAGFWFCAPLLVYAVPSALSRI